MVEKMFACVKWEIKKWFEGLDPGVHDTESGSGSEVRVHATE